MWLFYCLLAIYCLKAVVYLGFFRNSNIRRDSPPERKGPPTLSVDIVLPMYNEEKVILATIRNLLNISYKHFSVIVIDDGSTDRSYALVRECFGNDLRVRVIHQKNAGKSPALNRAMSNSKSDIIICIDADTLVRPDIIDRILPFFDDERVGAVSGYVKVGNRTNFLTDVQHVEYLTILNHERSVFESVNGILVVPGALGAFRRSAIAEVGGFTSEALAEDCDITLRMLCRNYIIRNASKAFSFTEVPASLKMFFRQRVRWTVGLAQGLLKHSKTLAEQSNKALVFLVVPFTWFYRIVLPVVIAAADYFFLFACFVLKQYSLLGVYLLCVLIEAAVSFFILARAKERMNIFKVILAQRLLNHLLLFTYLCILFKWFNGTLYGWDKITRQGNVKLDQ